MKAGKATIGHLYHSPKGAVVTVMALKDRKIVLKINETNTEVLVSKSYPLRKGALSQPLEELRQQPSQDRVLPGVKQNVPPLSQFIDPLLLESKKSIREIVENLRTEFGSRLEGKDLAANVRARIFHLKRRGWLGNGAR